MKLRGIYAITNILTDTVYYGQSTNIEQRLRSHRSALSRGNHHSQWLQRSWNKHGPGAFTFTPVRLVDTDDLTVHEKLCIDGAYEIGLRLFNLRIAEPSNGTGVVHTAETRAKMSKTRTGRRLSPSHAAAISAGRTGMTFTPEHRANLSVVRRSRVTSDLTRGRMAAGMIRNWLEYPDEKRAARLAGLNRLGGAIWTDASRAQIATTLSRHYAIKREENKGQ